jgi:hypothetical protein
MLRFSRFFRASMALLAVLVVSLSNLLAVSCTESGIGPVDPPDVKPPPMEKADTVFVGFYAARSTGSMSLPSGGTARVWVGANSETFNLPASNEFFITGDLAKAAYTAGQVDSVLVQVPGFIPMLIPSISKGQFRNVSGVLMEENWRVARGPFAGQSVNLSLIEAYTESGGTGYSMPFYSRTLPSNGGGSATKYAYNVRFVPDEMTPQPLVILLDTAQTQGITVNATDSTLIQMGADMVEEALGLDLFQTVRMEHGGQYTDCNAVVVVFTNTTTNGSGSPSPCGFSNSSPIRGATLLSWIGSFHHLYNGEPNWNMLTGWVAHELVHTMGFGHTVWPSLMQSAGGDKVGWNAKLVAYMEAYQRVRNLQYELNAPFGVPESHQGERRARGMPPELYFPTGSGR